MGAFHHHTRSSKGSGGNSSGLVLYHTNALSGRFCPQPKLYLFRRCDVAGVFWIEFDPLQLLSNTHAHQVVPHELKPGHTAALVLVQPPETSEELVGNSPFAEEAIRLFFGQHVPEEHRLPSDDGDGIVGVPLSGQALKLLLPEGIVHQSVA